jgi:hypothetical protein
VLRILIAIGSDYGSLIQVENSVAANFRVPVSSLPQLPIRPESMNGMSPASSVLCAICWYQNEMPNQAPPIPKSEMLENEVWRVG